MIVEGFEHIQFELVRDVGWMVVSRWWIGKVAERPDRIIVLVQNESESGEHWSADMFNAKDLDVAAIPKTGDPGMMRFRLRSDVAEFVAMKLSFLERLSSARSALCSLMAFAQRHRDAFERDLRMLRGPQST